MHGVITECTLVPGCLASSEEMKTPVLNLCLAVRKDMTSILAVTIPA